jgi:hypothetical protein
MPFDFEVPDHWQRDERPAGLSAVSYTVEKGKEKASVTVTPLVGDAGGVQANVERWRGQLKLEGPADLARDVRPFEALGRKASLVDIRNDKTHERIVGVILPLNGQTWFFKMTGPEAVVEHYKGEFETAVADLKFAKN